MRWLDVKCCPEGPWLKITVPATMAITTTMRTMVRTSNDIRKVRARRTCTLAITVPRRIRVREMTK